MFTYESWPLLSFRWLDTHPRSSGLAAAGRKLSAGAGSNPGCASVGGAQSSS